MDFAVLKHTNWKIESGIILVLKMNILIKKTTLKLLWKQFSFLNNYYTVNDMKILHAEHMRRSKCERMRCEWNNVFVLSLTYSLYYMLPFVVFVLSFRSMDYSDIIELTKVLIKFIHHGGRKLYINQRITMSGYYHYGDIHLL